MRKFIEMLEQEEDLYAQIAVLATVIFFVFQFIKVGL